jgi:hypothetical protein
MDPTDPDPQHCQLHRPEVACLSLYILSFLHFVLRIRIRKIQELIPYALDTSEKAEVPIGLT